MEQNALKNRNRGAEMCAAIRDEQERYREHDPHLQSALNDTYECTTKYLDPVLSKAIEEMLLYQPDQTADFLVQFLRGTLNPKKYTYVQKWPFEAEGNERMCVWYMHVTGNQAPAVFQSQSAPPDRAGMNSAVRDRPEGPTAYFAEFFEARTKFY